MNLKAIDRECRQEAHYLTQEQYRLYDAIWTRRIRITPTLYEHGEDTVQTINKLMPNFLTHDPSASPVDEVAEDFGFGSCSDLIEFLLDYKPRGPVRSYWYEKLMEERLGGVDDVPF